MVFTIDRKKCTYCGLCAEDCPAQVITLDRSSKTAAIKNSACIECSHCGMICPVGAVTVDGAPLPAYGDGLEELSAEQAEHFLNSKRSVRNYKPGALAEEDIDAILRAGSLTATASNSRQVEAVLLQGDGVRKLTLLVSGVLLKVVNLGRNPFGRQLLKLIGLRRYTQKDRIQDFHRRITDTVNGTKDAFFFNAPAVVILTYPAGGKRFGRTDCALAGQSMMLAAHSRGIGSCMIGFAEAALLTKGLRKKAGVSPDRRIGLIFTLGIQKPKYYRYPVRNDWKV